MSSFVSLNLESRTPIYEQIIEQIERFVALGVYKTNEQIPSIRELAANLGINPNTIKKSYEELESRGVIYTISTKGTFISNNTKNVINKKINEEIDNIKSIISDLEKMGISKDEILKKLE